MANVGNMVPKVIDPADLLVDWDLASGDQCAIVDLAHERYDDVIIEHAAHVHAHEMHSVWARSLHRATKEQLDDYDRRLHESFARLEACRDAGGSWQDCYRAEKALDATPAS